MEARRKNLEPEMAAVRFLGEEIEEQSRSVEKLKTSIQARIRQYSGNEVSSNQWDALMAQWRKVVGEKEAERQRLKDELSSLAVSNSVYLADDPGVGFDKLEFDQLDSEIKELQAKLDRN